MKFLCICRITGQSCDQNAKVWVVPWAVTLTDPTLHAGHAQSALCVGGKQLTEIGHVHSSVKKVVIFIERDILICFMWYLSLKIMNSLIDLSELIHGMHIELSVYSVYKN